jgi:hypothetical protein
MERYEMKNKGGESQITPRSRSNRFPHLEEILIGGNVDPDMPSLFPKKDSTSMGKIESRESFFKINNVGERGWEEVTTQRGRRGPFIVPSKI